MDLHTNDIWTYTPKMEELKKKIRPVRLCKFKNNKNTAETENKMYNVYSYGIISDLQVRN